jgi:sulfite reductase alpha subunit-like flavoprotein
MSLSLLFIVSGVFLILYGVYSSSKNKLKVKGDSTDQEKTINSQSETQDAQAVSLPESRGYRVWYGPVAIYYSTQTGTAAKFAKNLCKELKESYILSSVSCISECSIAKLKSDINTLHIFIVATHYEGDSPDDMNRFWKELKSTSEKGLLQGLKYTGFALGDLNYKYFCQTGRLLNKKLEQLGGQIVYLFGEGSNDQGKIYEYFEEWAIPITASIVSHIEQLDPDSAQKLLNTLDDGTFTISLDDGSQSDPILEPSRFDPAVVVSKCLTRTT